MFALLPFFFEIKRVQNLTTSTWDVAKSRSPFKMSDRRMLNMSSIMITASTPLEAAVVVRRGRRTTTMCIYSWLSSTFFLSSYYIILYTNTWCRRVVFSIAGQYDSEKKMFSWWTKNVWMNSPWRLAKKKRMEKEKKTQKKKNRQQRFFHNLIGSM